MSEAVIVCLASLVIICGLVGVVIWLLFRRDGDRTGQHDDLLKKVIDAHHTSIRAQQEMWTTMVGERKIMADERQSYVQDRTVLVSWLAQLAKCVDERNGNVENQVRVMMRELTNEAVSRLMDMLGGATIIPASSKNQKGIGG